MLRRGIRVYRETKKCRICGNTELIPILNLGDQYLTGVFPKAKDEPISSGPLELVKCADHSKDSCGLLQLRHSFDLNEMYGHNYGYRSGLNTSMVKHLHRKVDQILHSANLVGGDLIIDIGSNDGTLLAAYPSRGVTLVGIDPTGEKFKNFYPSHIELIPEFFSADLIRSNFGNQKAKVVTSIAMFYDLESPIDFMRQVFSVLSDQGIWVFEQSYMPTMLEMNAYDTVCHEHLEYYALKQIKWMTDRVGFKIIDVEMNRINGGSFSVTVAKAGSSFHEARSQIGKIAAEEHRRGLDQLTPYQEFEQRVQHHREQLTQFIQKLKLENKKLFGYGASTKGNVILQFCRLSADDLPLIAEVNPDKFGCYTPGTFIQIIREEEARAMKPDYFMVLPWHFKETILEKENHYLRTGGRLVFPLPSIQIVSS